MRAHRGWIVAGAVVAVAVVAAVVFVVVRTAGGGSATVSCTLAVPPPATGSVDSAGVRVAEQGFSASDDEFPLISIGAVLENTTDQVAYRTRVVFDAFDDGATVVQGAQVKYQIVEVPLILPGARVAVGDLFFGRSRAEVTRVSVTPAVTAWMPPGDAANGLAPITASVVAGSGKRADDGVGQFAVTARGDNCGALISRGLGAVWRDAAGQIVGGETETLNLIYACDPDGDDMPETLMTPRRAVPATADLNRTEVTALCDLQPSRRVSESGRPIN